MPEDSAAALAAKLTVGDLRIRAVQVPLGRPVATRVGRFESWPLILVDLTTESGITDIEDMLAGTGDNTATVECSSCHDVHNQGPAGVADLLIKSNASSDLCLTCHIK